MLKVTARLTRMARWGGRGGSAANLAEPSAGHASGFIQALGNVEELLLADPAEVMDDPTEDTKKVEVQVDVFKMPLFVQGLSPASLGDEEEGVEREVVDALSHGESMGLWDVGGALEGP